MTSDVTTFMSQEILTPPTLAGDQPTHRTSMIEDTGTCCNNSNCSCQLVQQNTESFSTCGKTSIFESKEQIIAVIQKLPFNSKQFLIYASCFGAELNGFVLNQFTENSNELISSHYELLASHGLLIENNNDSKCESNDDDTDKVWKFPSKSVIEVAYDMIPSTERSEFHYNIGRKLWQQLTVNEINQYIFVVVDQLLYGIELIRRKQDADENAAVAKLLLIAGERAVQISDFTKASDYFSHSISLLSDRAWRHEYELCLKIYNAAAEVAYCSGDFDHANSLVEVTLLHAQLFEDKIQAYVTKIFSYGTSGNLSAAIETGVYVLSRLGENVPLRPSKIQLLREILQARKKLNGMSDNALLNLPLLQDSKVESVMKILDAMSSYAHVVSVVLGGLVRLRIMNLTLSYGQSAMSPTGFLGYGVILVSMRNIDKGFRFGRLGYQMFEKQNATQWTGRIYLQYFGLIHSLKMPLEETVAHLKYGYQIALQKGDVEYAFLCVTFFLYFSLEISTLHDLKTDIVEIRQQMKMLRQEHSLAVTKLLDTFLMFVLGEENPVDGTRWDPTALDDNAFQFDEIVMETIRPWIHFKLMMVDYLFGNIDRAYRQVKVLLRYIEKTPSPVAKTFHALVLFYVGLVSTEFYRRNRSGLRLTKRALKMLRVLAKHAPCNVLGKQYLLEAELASVKKDASLAFSKYITAIAFIKETSFLTEKALSYELAAKFALSKRKMEMAESFYMNSIVHYQEWGSEPKVMNLQNEIGFHFSSPSSLACTL